MAIISTPKDGGTGFGYQFGAANDTLLVTGAGSVAGKFAIYSNYVGSLVQNNGAVAGSTGILLAATQGRVVNTVSGTITGHDTGVDIAGGTVVNYGSIDGTTAIHTAAASYVYNFGLIDGNVSAHADTTVINSGTIVGDIIFGAGSNTFQGSDGLNGAGQVLGDIKGGTGSDTFNMYDQSVSGTIDGGAGIDKISFVGTDAYQTLTTDLLHGTVSGDGLSFDIANIENVMGSRGSDYIYGTDGVNVISGGDGSDTVFAYGGNDLLDGGTGSDVLHGGAGDDTLRAGQGSGYLYGDDGTDTVSFASATAAVTVSLALQGTESAAGNLLTYGTSQSGYYMFGIEHLEGSAYGDKLSGDANANVLAGGAGDDWLYGAGGRDTLAGGAGKDTFYYNSTADSPASAPDLITDFVHGTDKLDLSALGITASDKLTISTSGGYTYVSLDIGNNNSVDMMIKLAGANNVISMSDIITVAPAVAALDTAHVALAHAAADHGLYA